MSFIRHWKYIYAAKCFVSRVVHWATYKVSFESRSETHCAIIVYFTRRRNSQNVVADILEYIFFEKKLLYLYLYSLNFVPTYPITNTWDSDQANQWLFNKATYVLKHWGPNKMATLRTTYSYTLSCIEIVTFSFNFPELCSCESNA